ncbi:carbohydrate ABC transporter permease [Actinomycetota bacterium]
MNIKKRYFKIGSKQKRKTKVEKSPYFLLAPGMIIIFIFVLLPIFLAIFLSITDISLLGMRNLNFNFVGIDNYSKFLTSADFRTVIWSTIFFVIGSVFLSYTIGMLVAVLLNQKIRALPLFRGLLILPWAVPQVVVSIIWKWMINPQYGIINYIGHKFGLIPEGFSFLGHPQFAMITILITIAWRSYPLSAVMLLAGMKTIPEELYEAASIDGASPMQRFLHITIPGLRYITSVLILLLTIWSIGNFIFIWVMTQGGPANNTAILAIFSYLSAFKFGKLGYGAAIGVIALMVSLIVSVIYYKVFMQKAEDEK